MDGWTAGWASFSEWIIDRTFSTIPSVLHDKCKIKLTRRDRRMNDLIDSISAIL